MKNNIQDHQAPNNLANHFWEKPIGKIVISVIAGTIVIVIGIGINRSCVIKPATSTKNAEPDKKETNNKIAVPITQDTPEKIMSEIKLAPPLQQDDIAKTYVGIPVEWQLYFFSGSSDNKEYHLFLRSSLKIDSVFVVCSIPKENNDYLRRLPADTKLRIQGNIDKIDSSFITLKDAKIVQ